MTAPTTRQIRDLLAPLHELGRTLVPNGPTNAERLEQRILNAVARDTRTPATRNRDGYPTGAGPGDGGETVPQSSTEAAAWSNLNGQQPDPLADHVEQLVGHLVEAINHLGALTHRLVLIDKISDPRGTTNPTDTCRACGRLVECTSADPIRAGYCNACDCAFRRWKTIETEAGRDADRARFERQRRQELAA